MGFFCPKKKMHELNIQRGVIVITPKNDKKAEEELTCRFKIDIKNLTNFDSSIRKSEKLALQWAAFDQSI